MAIGSARSSPRPYWRLPNRRGRLLCKHLRCEQEECTAAHRKEQPRAHVVRRLTPAGVLFRLRSAFTRALVANEQFAAIGERHIASVSPVGSVFGLVAV